MDEDDVTVRVAVRIRPQIPREIIDMCQVCTRLSLGEPQVLLGSDKAFTYDYVFDSSDDQESVFDICVEPLINQSLEGYNATILAYGQTGSGKTYTMGSGFDVDVPNQQIGIIPRAIEYLYKGIRDRIQAAEESGALQVPKFQVMAQFMELYNEEIIDLFNPLYNKEKSYKIHEDPDGIQVKGVTLKAVSSPDEAMQCLRMGALSRTTASTKMNTQSSRSHAIFTLHIKQQRSVPSEIGDSSELETLTAKFHFVDLAGSERLKRTGATGDRAKEGISINCGLLALGNVISALGDKSRKALHVPYRDSKLTRLLQDSLGGNSRTVMIACVSPSDSDFMETLNTLKYANRARNIKNKLTINQDKSSHTITELRHQLESLQLELIEYKQGKRMVGDDGTEIVNDMFYENNLLQDEITNLRLRIKAMQQTIDSLTLKNTNLLVDNAVGNWIGLGTDNQVTDMVQTYIKEIEELQAKLIEANNTCEQLRKQMNKSASMNNTLNTSMDASLVDIPSLLEEAKREIRKEKHLLDKTRRSSEMEESDISEYESDGEEKGPKVNLNLALFTLNNDIDTKQKLIDELERSQSLMQKMRQNYEEKLMQLQVRIKNTQEERDKVLHSYTTQAEPTENVKKVKEEYGKKLTDMQKELRRLHVAQKEHARLLRNQSQQDTQLKAFKNEVLDMKRVKVKLINKMKEESQRHKESEMKRLREIEQLRKETRKNANVIKAMEVERKIKEQVYKRKQEEISNLRKSQRSRLKGKSFTEKLAKQKWLKVEKAINNMTISKKKIIDQEVRMEYFLKKREELRKELITLEDRKKEAVLKNLDTSQLDSFIEDIEENINYVQEIISETQHKVMQIEESQNTNDTSLLQQIVDSVYDIDESKYLLEKMFNMTLSQSHMVLHKDAKLKENETVLAELQQESTLKGQLLDHVLHSEFPMFSKELTTSISSTANDTSSTYSSRSPSPSECLFNPASSETIQIINKTKIRQRTAKHGELLFGTTNV